MVKVGDVVFAKTFDVYTEDTEVRPGIVTRLFTEEDGEFAKDREIIGVLLFSHKGTEYVDMDKGTTDDNGDWVAGGWSENYDGPTKTSDTTTQAATTPTAVPASDSAFAADAVSTSPSDPASGTVGSVGSVGASADNPALDPAATSGASTGTIGDGASDAPVNQGV